MRIEGGDGRAEWRHLGVLSAGVIGRCGQGYYADLNAFVSWIEGLTQVDVTPCHDLDGRWAPTPACLRVRADQASTAEPPSFAFTCGGPYVEAGNDYDLIEVTIDEIVAVAGQGPVTVRVSATGGRPRIRRVRAELLGSGDQVVGAAVDDIPPYELSMFPGEGHGERVRVIADDFYGATGSAEMKLDALPQETSAGCAVRPPARNVPRASLWAAALILVGAAVLSRRPA